MADFCQQCSIETFGQDFGDLANLCTEEENKKNLYAVALCEGCGPTQVDAQGFCVHHNEENHIDL